MDLSIFMDSFNDELQKIAGSLQGFVRGGKRPISAAKLLSNEKSKKFIKQKKAVITKLARLGMKGQAVRAGLVLGGGAGLYHLGRRANEDRKLGKMVRLQQGQ